MLPSVMTTFKYTLTQMILKDFETRPIISCCSIITVFLWLCFGVQHNFKLVPAEPDQSYCKLVVPRWNISRSKQASKQDNHRNKGATGFHDAKLKPSEYSNYRPIGFSKGARKTRNNAVLINITQTLMPLEIQAEDQETVGTRAYPTNECVSMNEPNSQHNAGGGRGEGVRNT